MRYFHHTHAILHMTLSFAAETVTVPLLQSREINYHNTHKIQQNHTLKNKQIPKSQQKMFKKENRGCRRENWEQRCVPYLSLKGFLKFHYSNYLSTSNRADEIWHHFIFIKSGVSYSGNFSWDVPGISCSGRGVCSQLMYVLLVHGWKML